MNAGEMRTLIREEVRAALRDPAIRAMFLDEIAAELRRTMGGRPFTRPLEYKDSAAHLGEREHGLPAWAARPAAGDGRGQE